MTLGQVLLAFDGMSEYVILTAPFGGGDAKSPNGLAPGASTRTMEQAADPSFVREFGGTALNRQAQHLPECARSVLGLT
jgi:hypothetical protein